LRIRRSLLTATVLGILLAALAAPMIAVPTLASDDEQSDEMKVVPGQWWYKLETDIITVLFPAGGRKPMFIWWYTGKPDQIFVVKYQGLIEYFAFDHPLLPLKPDYYNRMREASRERFEEMYTALREQELMQMGPLYRLELLHQIMMEINQTWHRPFFPFNAAKWNLSEVKNITADGTMVGVSFAFKLVKVPYWMPAFKFAENNIMIRVRFYNTTVVEKDPDTGYEFTVNANEMKMDFVINKWEWNIDAIKELLTTLKTNGIDVNVPLGKSRLALWVNLASINITKLPMVDEEGEPERIEEHSTATHMDVEGVLEDIRPNMTQTSTSLEKAIEINRPFPPIKLRFANETTTLAGFFRFVSSAKVKDFPQTGDVGMVPVKAAYIAAGAHMRLFIGYPYFGNGSLEHDPSIGVEVPERETTPPPYTAPEYTVPQYTVQVPSGINEIEPKVIGKYILPLFTVELAAVLVGAVSIVAIITYVIKWKRKTPVNMVGAS